MRSELITKDEMLALLREQGVDDVGDVKQAGLEADGRVSVIEREPRGQDAPPGRESRRGPAT